MNSSLLLDEKRILDEMLAIAAFSFNVNYEIVDIGGQMITSLGQNIAHHTALAKEPIYKNVFETEKEYIIEAPRKNKLCQKCKERNRCLRKLCLAFPLFAGDEIAGIFGLFAYTIAQREVILKDLDSSLDYFRKIVNRINGHLTLTVEKENIQNCEKLLKNCACSHGKHYFKLENDIITECDEYLSEIFPYSFIGQNVIFEKVSDKIYNLEIGEKSVFISAVINSYEKYKFIVFDIVDKDYVFIKNSSCAYDDYPIIGSSEEMTKFKSLIEKMSKTNSTIFISGPKGSGKEFAARKIHSGSLRKAFPFVKIDCKNFLSGEAESFLLGKNENGGFSHGALKQADGGVLFIDNAHYLSKKIFCEIFEKVISDKKYKDSLGNIHNIDVRIIFSSEYSDTLKALYSYTSKDINYIPLKVLPLKNSKEDIKDLVLFYINKYKVYNSIDNIYIPDDIMSMLCNYGWSGNIRQLQFVCAKMAEIFQANSYLSYEAVRSLIPKGDFSVSSGEFKTLKEVENYCIELAIEKYGDTTFGKQMAAKELGIGIATLYRKLNEKLVSEK